MSGRIARAWLVAIVTVALWTLARPAFAMPAPLCDDRGATGLAPAPTLIAPDDTIERAFPPLPCDDDERLACGTISPAHGELPAPPSSVDPVAPPACAALAPPAGAELDPSFVSGHAADGVRSRVDRPPRG